MKQVKVMPKGYDPRMLSPTPDGYEAVGRNWTAEDTKRCQEMYNNAPVLTVEDDWKPPVGQWYEVQ